MYGGHLGLFYISLSYSSHWDNMFCMTYLFYTLIRIKCTYYVFYAFEIWVHRHFRWRFITVLTYNPTDFMFIYINHDPKILRHYAETLVFVMFSRQGNRPGIYLKLSAIPTHTTPYHTMPCHAMPYHTIPYHALELVFKTIGHPSGLV